MPVLSLQDPGLATALAAPGTTLVACLCADWCGTCREYRPKFDALAARFPSHVFVWIDIEDEPELAGDDDIENFPTLHVQGGAGIAFHGVMLPHIGHLEKLLGSLEADAPRAPVPGPDILGMLRDRPPGGVGA